MTKKKARKPGPKLPAGVAEALRRKREGGTASTGQPLDESGAPGGQPKGAEMRPPPRRGTQRGG